MKKFGVVRMYNGQMVYLATEHQNAQSFDTEEEARAFATKQATTYVSDQFAVVRAIWVTESVVSVSGEVVP